MPEELSQLPTTLPAPVARGLSGWPLAPPPFDPMEEQIVVSADEAQAIEDLAGLVDRLTNCGVSASRQNSPDLLAQLHLALKRPIDSIICTVLDVDPAACVQSAYAAQHAEDLVSGLATLARVCRATRRLLVIDSRGPDRWFSSLRSLASSQQPRVRILELENDYPQADPSLLMYTILNRRLKPQRLPAELGAIILDAAAAGAIGACIRTNAPFKSTPLVLRDHDRGESYFLSAPVGITSRRLLDDLGLLNPGDELPENAPLLRAGDVLRDQQLSMDAKLGAGELLVHLSTKPKSPNPDACIRCAWCLEACPTRIQPATLLEAAQRDDIDLAERAGLRSCIECGICQYVCPSKLPILRGIRELRLRDTGVLARANATKHGRDARVTEEPT